MADDYPAWKDDAREGCVIELLQEEGVSQRASALSFAGAVAAMLRRAWERGWASHQRRERTTCELRADLLNQPSPELGEKQRRVGALAQAVLRELDVSHPSAPTVAGLRQVIRDHLRGEF